MTIPNLLSLSRLALALVFVMVSQPTHQAIVIALAGLSDMVDGWIARRFAQRSRMGELLDPITDKLFVLTVVVTLLVRAQLLPWQVLVLLTRDLFNTAAFAYLKLRGTAFRFKSRPSGKVVTILQIATLLTALIFPGWLVLALWITFAASIVAIADYARAGLASMRERP